MNLKKKLKTNKNLAQKYFFQENINLFKKKIKDIYFNSFFFIHQ
jgi:hypothetical protein